MERLLSPAEVAELIPIGYHAILRAIRAGELRASRLRGHYAIRPSDLESWVESNVAFAVPRVGANGADAAARHQGSRTLSGQDEPRGHA